MLTVAHWKIVALDLQQTRQFFRRKQQVYFVDWRQRIKNATLSYLQSAFSRRLYGRGTKAAPRLFMVALWNRADHYIFILFLSFFFDKLYSPYNGSIIKIVKKLN